MAQKDLSSQGLPEVVSCSGASVGPSVGESVGPSVGESVGPSVGPSVGESVGSSVGKSVTSSGEPSSPPVDGSGASWARTNGAQVRAIKNINGNIFLIDLNI